MSRYKIDTSYLHFQKIYKDQTRYSIYLWWVAATTKNYDIRLRGHFLSYEKWETFYVLLHKKYYQQTWQSGN